MTITNMTPPSLAQRIVHITIGIVIGAAAVAIAMHPNCNLIPRPAPTSSP